MGRQAGSWYTVYTKPRQERVAFEHLGRQGFRCYLPLANNPYQKINRGGARKQAVEPLFPRYLFLNAEPSEQSLSPVRSTKGVASLVRFGNRLAEVHHSVIRAMKNRRDPETGLIQLDPIPVGPGDRVEVFDGPLAGIEGIFKERTGECRALLLMQLLGRESTVEVNSLHLKKAV